MDTPIDIPLPDGLRELLSQPACLSLPRTGRSTIHLPGGGTMQGMVDVTRGIPDDCSLNFSLVMPLMSLLSSTECLIKLLKLVKPLIDIVTGLTKVPPAPPVEAVGEFAKAAAELAPCLLLPTPAAMIPFVRDILLLIIKLLKCITGQLKSILAVMGGLSLQISSARQNGNTELLAALECAQGNAQASAQHMMSAIDPVLVLLSLAEPFLGMAGVSPIKTPALAPGESLEAMTEVVTTLDDLVKTLQLIADGLGG
ncbi:hypothetical protein [Chitinimonas lacunae]|uniref:Uncharacterized protein n=1 Tax=Chitinimonas lacunae TaxID=1963018 RepID=A0ABV8MKG6_9NEIS